MMFLDWIYLAKHHIPRETWRYGKMYDSQTHQANVKISLFLSWFLAFIPVFSRLLPFIHVYRNWPRYGLRWSGWYCNPEQHELCRLSRGRLRPRRPAQRVVVNFYSTTITIYRKSKGNLRFRRLVPLFVPIGVCVTTHDDGTASDVTIGMWRHNQQVTNHERNGKPWFSLPK